MLCSLAGTWARRHGCPAGALPRPCLLSNLYWLASLLPFSPLALTRPNPPLRSSPCRHKKLALRLLDAVPKGQRPELLALPVGRPPRTLLHMALQSDDQPLVARLLSELDRERKQRLLQLAVEDRDGPLLRLLVALPGVSAAGVSLHAAIGWLPRELEPLTPLELVQWLVKAGASINQRDVEDGSLPTHKVGRIGVGCEARPARSGEAHCVFGPAAAERCSRRVAASA